MEKAGDRFFFKLNYLSYDTLFVKIGADLFSKDIHKVWQFSVFRKNTENIGKYQHSHFMFAMS